MRKKWKWKSLITHDDNSACQHSLGCLNAFTIKVKTINMVALKKFRGRLINGGWLDYSCLCMVNEADVSTSFLGGRKKCQLCHLWIRGRVSWCFATFMSIISSPGKLFWNFQPLIPKRLTVIHTFIHWWRWLPCKVPTSTSGAVWGSVSCPRTRRYAARGSRDFEPATFQLLEHPALTPQATATNNSSVICLIRWHL